MRICRILLGLIFFTFGLNGFYEFIPVPEQAPAGAAFIQAMRETGYIIYLFKKIEVIAGGLLLANRFTPLALILLAPITINIFFYHLIIEPLNLSMGLILNGALLLFHGEAYRELMRAKAPPSNVAAGTK